METSSSPDSDNPNDDVFFDALEDCPFHHCSGESHDDSPECYASASTLCHPDPPSPSPATTLRRRSIRRRSPVRDSTDYVGLESGSNLINGARTSFPRNESPEILKENENIPEKHNSNQGRVHSFPSPSVVTEEKNEESTLTTAANDDALADSADSALELGYSSSNSLEYIVGLVIRAIMFQIKLFVLLMKFPMLLLFHGCMFFVDPLGTIRKGKGFLMGIVGRACACIFGCMGSSSLQDFFKDHKSLLNVAFRCGWGFLWSIYVCCILMTLLVSSFVVSGFLVKCLVEEPFQMRQVLNFDYTKQSPVAHVPIMSCAGVGGGQDSENIVAVSGWLGKRVIPARQKVQITVSLIVPESGYNRNLGVFQIKVDFLSSNGKTIASASQPCMLKFRSELVRLITTFLKIAPLVTGYVSETQTLNVKMIGLVVGDVPISCLKVTLEQRAEYLPGAGIPEIYDSSILIESELPLFKRIIWYWKISIFIWITIMAFMTELLFVLLCCWPIIIPRTRQSNGLSRSTGTRNNLQATS